MEILKFKIYDIKNYFVIICSFSDFKDNFFLRKEIIFIEMNYLLIFLLFVFSII